MFVCYLGLGLGLAMLCVYSEAARYAECRRAGCPLARGAMAGILADTRRVSRASAGPSLA